MPNLPHSLSLRRHFQRVVLTRPWLTFLLMGLAFFSFGVSTLNLLHLLQANIDLLISSGVMAALDGGAYQLFMLLADGYAAMLAYVVLKTCEHALSDWLSGRTHQLSEAGPEVGGLPAVPQRTESADAARDD